MKESVIHKKIYPEPGRKASPLRRRRVFVGMSGGVDSSVAAALLKKKGYDVVGVFMKNWADPKYPCPWQEDRRDAMRVAAMLDIPFETWDFTREYRKLVVGYMIREYAAGRTPNPDVMCNREIKFGLFLNKARAEGADFIATGHYVRLRTSTKNLKLRAKKSQKLSSKIYILNTAADAAKDQSYFLWTLTQDQLSRCLFPIGDYAKTEVRELARRFVLPTADKPDSQGICFVGEIDVREFLRDYIPGEPGKVLTTSGKVVGEHDGVQFYTIGQRHGMGVGGGIPFYVAEKDLTTNTLVVAEGPHDDKLFQKELSVRDVNWIAGEPEWPLSCEARIRYRQPPQRCRVERQETRDKEQGKRTYRVSHVTCYFDEDQRAVTPGQSIVFYDGKVMLGGGIIG